MRGVSQMEPKATVVCTRSKPDGRSLLSLSCVSAMAKLGEHVAHRAIEHLALLGEDQPARMTMEQRHAEESSSALICRLTADWLKFSVSPACVKLPASATA